jgi:hypothetical protein
MAKLERDQTVLTPKADKTGTRALKRNTVEVEQITPEMDEAKVAQLKKSRMRMIITFFILDLALFAVVIYQVVSIFMQIGKAATNA